MIVLSCTHGRHQTSCKRGVIPKHKDVERITVRAFGRGKDVIKLNGEIAVVVKANGQPVKSFKTQVRGGQLQGLERTRLGFEPHTAFISPRYVDTTDKSRSSYMMRDMFWLTKSQ